MKPGFSVSSKSRCNHSNIRLAHSHPWTRPRHTRLEGIRARLRLIMASKKDQKQVTEPLQSAKQPHPAKSKDTSPLTPVTPNVRPKQSTSPPSNLLRLVLLALPFVVTYIHVLLAPYTKVEETPALHAVHDIMKYGTSAENISKVGVRLWPAQCTSS